MRESFSNVIRVFSWDFIRKAIFFFFSLVKSPARERTNRAQKENRAMGKCHKTLCTCHWNTQIPRAFCVTLLKPQSRMRIIDYWIFCPHLLVSEGEENETACSAAESTWDHKTRHRSALSPPGEEASSSGAHWLSPRCPFVSLRVGTLTGNPIMLIWDNRADCFPP